MRPVVTPVVTVAVAPNYDDQSICVTVSADDQPELEPTRLHLTPAQAAQIGLWLRDCAECVRFTGQKLGEKNAGEEKTEPLMRGSSRPRRHDKAAGEEGPALTLAMGGLADDAAEE